jgi:tetratricopeptide (TPR) repeat protein
MDQRLLLNGVRHPERLEGVSGDELEQLLQTLPAFEAGQLLNLRRLKANHSSRLPMVTDRTAAAAAQGQWVYRALNPTEALAPELVETAFEAIPPSRLAWFEKLSGLDSETEEALLAMGYAEALAGDLLEADATLDAWFAGSHVDERKPAVTVPMPSEKAPSGTDPIRDLAALSLNTNEIPVSESLAELHLRQGQRQRAAQIYRKLMLRFPAKTTYFAARLEQIQSDND